LQNEAHKEKKKGKVCTPKKEKRRQTHQIVLGKGRATIFLGGEGGVDLSLKEREEGNASMPACVPVWERGELSSSTNFAKGGKKEEIGPLPNVSHPGLFIKEGSPSTNPTTVVRGGKGRENKIKSLPQSRGSGNSFYISKLEWGGGKKKGPKISLQGGKKRSYIPLTLQKNKFSSILRIVG